MKTYIRQKNKKQIRLAELAGYGGAPNELLPLITFLKGEGEETVKGVMLFGPAGMQHGRLAEMMALESNCRLINIACASINREEGLEDIIIEAFHKAEASAPCILCSHQIEQLFAQKEESGKWETVYDNYYTWVNGLEAISPKKRILLLATSSRPDLIPSMALRPGRLDQLIAIDKPDKGERGAVLAQWLDPEELAPGVSPEQIGEKAYGFSLDDLEEMIRVARNLARLKYRKKLIGKDFEDAIREIAEEYKKEWGGRRKLSPEKNYEVAVHEAGHVVAAWFSAYADEPLRTSIKPRGIAINGQTDFPPCAVANLSYEALLARLGIALAGSAAVTLILKKECTGSSIDLATFDELCEHIVARRFPEKQGLYKMEKEQQLKRIALEKTKEFLRPYHRQLKVLAEQLFDQEELDQAQITATLGEPVAPNAQLPQTTLPPARHPFQGSVDVFY